jgi:hypothetical protein
MPIVFSATVTETSALVHLPTKAGFYVWNVATLGPDGTHLSADWNWFSVSPSDQSLASGPH